MRNSDFILINDDDDSLTGTCVENVSDDDKVTEICFRDIIHAKGGADTISGGPQGDTINPGIDNSRDVIKYENFSERMDVIYDFDRVA
ncbi:MAG: hypothetical protein F6K55_28620 [Moorea sp. SIO4A3]|nr:hypothetical protein [Moorena sp. SIO4A3]